MIPAIKRLPRVEDFRAADSHGNRAGYLNHALGGTGKKKDQAEHRRARGLCADCGRPLQVMQLDQTAAVLNCRCGYSTVAAPGSGLYKRARDLRELEALRP